MGYLLPGGLGVKREKELHSILSIDGRLISWDSILRLLRLFLEGPWGLKEVALRPPAQAMKRRRPGNGCSETFSVLCW